MSSHEQHEVVFRWPHIEPNNVFVTGTFDDWKKTIPLKRTPTGFETRIRLPYGEKTPYKFIVDGTWLVDESNPTEYDNVGNLNNVYNAPPPPPPQKVTPPTTPVIVGGFETAKQTASPEKSNGHVASTPSIAKGKGDDKENSSKPPSPRLSLSDFANTFTAREGTTSAFQYVKSGLGAILGGVVGVDPINVGQIAIPTPNTAASFNTMIPAPGEPASPVPAPEAAPTSAVPTEEPAPIAAPQPTKAELELAPKVPIAIVPVNSAEHTTISNDDKPTPGDATHSPVVGPVKPESPVPAPSEPEPVKEEIKEKEEDVPATVVPIADAPVLPKEEVVGPAIEEEEAPVEPAKVEEPQAQSEPASAPEPEAKVERPATPAPVVAAPTTPSKSTSKDTANSSAPTTPLSVKKGSSSSHFKRASLSGAFGSIRGKKEKKNDDDVVSSSSSEESSVNGSANGKKKRKSLIAKIKRVFSPHHHHHHHHHDHANGQEKEKDVKV